MKLLHKAKSDVFVSTSFSIFLVRFFPSLALTLVMIFFSRQLSFDSYGYYQQYYTQALLLAAIACAGIQALVVTYDTANILGLLKSLSARSYVLFSGWLVALSIVFAGLQPYHGFPYALSFIFLLAYCFQVITEALLISCRKFGWLIIISVLYSVLFAAFHALVLIDILSFKQLFFALSLLSLSKGLLCLFILRKEINIASTALPSIAAAQKLWKQLGIYDMLQVVFRWVDKFILGFILTKTMFAIYYNGSVDIPFIPIMLGAAGSAVLMQLATKKTNESEHTIGLMHHTSRLLSSLVFPLFLLLLIYRYEFFEVVFSAKYFDAVPIFFMATLVLPLRAYSFTAVLQSQHKGAILNIGAGVDLLLACGLMYPLYKLLGLPGIALAFVVSTYVQAGFYLWHTARLLKVNMGTLIPFKNWLLKLILFSVVLIIIHYSLYNLVAPVFVLILGSVCALSMACLSLALDLCVANKYYGKTSA